MNVDFGVTGQLLIIYSAFVRYLRKIWEYNEAVYQLFIDVKKAYDSGKVIMELQLDATITVLLISKISSTCFGQIFAHLQERKT
jgi:hypothetical protein